MYGTIFFSHITEDFDKLLPGLSGVSDYALLVAARNNSFDVTDFEVLCNAFPGLRCIAWSAITAKADSTDEFTEAVIPLNGFSEYPILAENILTSNVFRLVNDELIFAQNTAWVEPTAYPELAELVEQAVLRRNGVISFIPDSPTYANAWALTVHGLGWEYLTRTSQQLAGIEYPDFAPTNGTLLLDYVRLTQTLGGIPVIICAAPETAIPQPLLFLGREEQIQRAVSRLREFYEVFSGHSLQEWFYQNSQPDFEADFGQYEEEQQEEQE